MEISLVVLAAGMGSRYGGLKQIDPIWPNGETILHYCVFDAIRAGFDKVVFVIRKDFEEAFREKFHADISDKIKVEYAFQEMDKLPEGYSLQVEREKPWGTAHALRVAKDYVKWPFAMINADDFYWKDWFMVAGDFLKNHVNESNYWIISYMLSNTLSDHGTVNRGVCNSDDGKFMSWITECKWIGKKQENGVEKVSFVSDEWVEVELEKDTFVSMNFFAFDNNIFERIEEHFKGFLDTYWTDPRRECYIPEVLDDLNKKDLVKIELLKCESKWFWVTYQEDKPVVIQKINDLIAQWEYPEKLFG